MAVSRWSKVLNRAGRSPLSKQWTKLHAELYRRTGGRFLPNWFGGPVMVLEVVGRKSGAVRRVPVIRVTHGDGFVVVPSNAGSHKTPAWWLNLRDAGEGWVIHRGKRTHVRPRVTEGAERDRLWRRFTEVYAGLDDYATFTDREWPVVLLEPVE